MAKRRSHATELVQMLDRPDRPVYVLDDQGAIVFCNRACLDWLGPAGEDLLGRRCLYHSSPEVEGPDAVAAGLCPPPAVFQGREVAANVCRLDPTGRAVFRTAKFIPLPMEDEAAARGGQSHFLGDETNISGEAPSAAKIGTVPSVIGVVAIVGGEDLSEPPPAAPADADEDESLRLRELLQRYRGEAASLYGLDRLLGESAAMRRARAQAELAAGCRANVLLVGPPGSGRQHAATAIHYGRAADAAGPLVPLACALLGPEMIRTANEAVAAASRPARRDTPGTLLLLQADQVPQEIQAELAAILSARPFPMRLIATAEQSLLELARRGRCREDLAALLSTIAIELPPLAQRREDLPLLAQLFLEDANARGGKQLGGFSPEALDRLDGYSWPGNLDELAQTVAQSHVRAAGPLVEAEDLPERLRWAAETVLRPRRKDETIVLDEFLGRIERELIRRALARAKGNKAKAARLLGLTRPRLYRRMVLLGLEEG